MPRLLAKRNITMAGSFTVILICFSACLLASKIHTQKRFAIVNVGARMERLAQPVPLDSIPIRVKNGLPAFRSMVGRLRIRSQMQHIKSSSAPVPRMARLTLLHLRGGKQIVEARRLNAFAWYPIVDHFS